MTVKVGSVAKGKDLGREGLYKPSGDSGEGCLYSERWVRSADTDRERSPDH